ncbi:MAG: EscU/YscU/HrcU family type III secretion system export apparatus switch protein [Myxococcota bacterium]
MSEAEKDEKTEEPTARQIEKFRERGDIAKSQELNSAAMLVGSTLTLALFASSAAGPTMELAQFVFSNLHDYENTLATIDTFIAGVAVEIGSLYAPGFALLMVMGLGVGLGQTRFLWTTKVFEFKPEKFDPIKGIKRVLFSADTVVNTLRNAAKVLLLGAAGAASLWYFAPDVRDLVSKGPWGTAETLVAIVVYPFLANAIVMILVGVADYAWQRHRTHERMKMTKEEVKREMKETEGDPLFKSRRRQKHMELLSVNEMVEAVSAATVVLNNPTHFSVALRYADGDGAPTVIAKGADHIALRIREKAGEHGVPMLTRPPLARALYKDVEVGKQIPEEFFQAVAEILAYVYVNHSTRRTPR